MVKKVIALGILLALTTTVVSAQVQMDPTEHFNKSGMNLNFSDEEVDNSPAVVGKVTYSNQIVDEDSDGEGVSAYPRLSAMKEYGKSNKFGASFARACSKVLGWFLSF
ncbi:MAG: hypothetical protein H0X26_03450 [Alphaproteobacteria bacterium]|nr:hypothetical protein [Alphaproteobacteria bacterium]